jgi:hypothetical protein
MVAPWQVLTLLERLRADQVAPQVKDRILRQAGAAPNRLGLVGPRLQAQQGLPADRRHHAPFVEKAAMSQPAGTSRRSGDQAIRRRSIRSGEGRVQVS